MDKYDTALLRRLRIIDELIIDELIDLNSNRIANKKLCKTNTLTRFIEIMVEYAKVKIMIEHFKIPFSTIFYDITDEHKEFDLKVTHFIENKYMDKLNEYYHNVNTGLN